MPDIYKKKIKKRLKQLVEEGAASLEELEIEDFIPVDDNPPSLIDFYNELGSLKTEMKQMNRMENKRVNNLQDFIDNTKENNKKLVTGINEQVELTKKIAQGRGGASNKGFYLSIIELRDFVEKFHISIPSLPFNENGIFHKRSKRSVELEDTIDRNVSFILKKIDTMLEKAYVIPILSLNQPFNPSEMIVVDTTSDEKLGNNIVVQEEEKGYKCKGEIIRFARVVVNKL